MLKKYVILFLLLCGGTAAIASDKEDKINQNAVFRIQPDIPKYVSENGISGEVHVTFIIQKDGSITDFEITKSSGDPILDEEAKKATFRATTKPLIINDTPRAVRYKTKFTYTPAKKDKDKAKLDVSNID